MAMFGGDTAMTIVIKAKDEASKVFNELESKIKKSAKGFTSVGKKMSAGLTAPLVALGTGSILAAGNFEKSMGDLETLVGEGTDSMTIFEKGIKDMLKTTPKSADDLGASAYSIVSSGVSDANEALKVLKSSSKLAISGLATTEQSTDLLTTALNAFGKDASDADEVANILFKTVKAGKTTVADMAQSFGKMAGNASAAGIPLEDVQAATAALTTVTGKTSESQNALAQVFLELTTAGGKLDKGLGDAGGSLQDLNSEIKEKGLIEGMENMRDKLGLTDTEFKNLFSSAEGGTAIFQLLTSANKTAKDTYTDLTNGVDAMSTAVEAQNDQFQQQWQLLKNKLNVSMIELGETIMPTVKIVMEKVADAVSRLATWFGDLSPKTKKFVIIGLVLLALLGPVLLILGGLLTVLPLIGAAFAILAGPVGLVIAAIGLLIFIIKKWKDNLDIVMPQVLAIWGKIKEGVGSAVDWIAGKVQKVIDLWNIMINLVKNPIKTAGGLVKGTYNKAKEALGLNKEHGGIIPGPRGMPVPIMAHGQERVIPANQAGNGSGGLSVTINNPVFRNNEDQRRLKQTLDKYFRPLITNHKLSL